MKKHLLLAALLIILIVSLTLGGLPLEERVVIVPRIIIIEKPAIEKIVEKPVEVIREVERVIYYQKPIYINITASATPEELARVDKDLAYGRYAHQFMVDNLWAQNIYTGDTAFNLYWLESYDLIKELRDRAYK